MLSESSRLLLATHPPGGSQAARWAPAADVPALPPDCRRYQVEYQLSLAEVRCGRVTGRFVARCSCCFCTDDLSIILADLYHENRSNACLLGLEIVAVHRHRPAAPGRRLRS